MDETKRRELYERLGCDPDDITVVETDDSEVGEVVLLLLGALHRKVDKLMGDVTALLAEVEALRAATDAENTELTTIVTELESLIAEVATLQAGVGPSQETIDSITSSLTNIANASLAATDAAKAAAAPPAPPVEPPPPPAAAPTKPVYQHLVGDAIDETQWSLSGFETAPTDGSAALPLYYFAGDVDGGGATGAVEGAWQVYTDAVQAVPAA